MLVRCGCGGGWNANSYQLPTEADTCRGCLASSGVLANVSAAGARGTDEGPCLLSFWNIIATSVITVSITLKVRAPWGSADRVTKWGRATPGNCFFLLMTQSTKGGISSRSLLATGQLALCHTLRWISSMLLDLGFMWHRGIRQSHNIFSASLRSSQCVPSASVVPIPMHPRAGQTTSSETVFRVNKWFADNVLRSVKGEFLPKSDLSCLMDSICWMEWYPSIFKTLLQSTLFQYRALAGCWFHRENALVVITGLHARWLVVIINNGYPVDWSDSGYGHLHIKFYNKTPFLWIVKNNVFFLIQYLWFDNFKCIFKRELNELRKIVLSTDIHLLTC